MALNSRKPMTPPEFVPGINWATRLARVFNIPDAHRVRSLKLDCPALGLVTVEVTLAVEAGQLDAMEAEARRYAVSVAPLDAPAQE
jgi:hypothetical protein